MDGFLELASLLLEKEVIFADDLERIFGPRVGGLPEENTEEKRESKAEETALEEDVKE